MSRPKKITDWKAYRRQYKLLSKYNLTEEEFNDMVLERDGRCDICRRSRPLVVDHDHSTGRVRGLLCDRCNHGLGHFQDNVSSLLNAAMYLEVNG